MRRVMFVTLTAGLALVLLVVLWVLFGGRTHGPQRELIELVPERAKYAVHLDASVVRTGLLWETLTTSEPFADLRDGLDVDVQLVEPLGQLEQRLADATLGLVGSEQVLEDVFGGEVIFAGDAEGWVVLSRLSGGVDAAQRLGLLSDDVLAGAGLTRRDGLLTLDGGDVTLFATIADDLLVVGTSVGWVRDSLAAPDTPRAPLLRHGEPAPVRLGIVQAWVDAAALLGDRGPAPPGTGEAFLRALAPPEELEPLALRMFTNAPDRVVVEIEGRFLDLAPDPVAGISPSVDETNALRALADTFAVPGETMVVAGSPALPAGVLLGLIHAQPASRRELVRQHLERAELTPEQVAAEMGARFDIGVALVVARMAEAEDIALDRWNEGAAHPIPATLLAFRLAPGAAPSDVLADLERFGEILLGDPLEPTAEPGPGGASVHHGESGSLGPAWTLLTPCVAFVDGLCVFCTNAAYLDRALQRHASRRGRASEQGWSALTLDLSSAPLRAYVDDLRWEHAERATNRDWMRERRRLGADLDLEQPHLPAIERERLLDGRMDALIDRRNLEEFPLAIERWREAWSPLRGLGSARIDAWRKGPAFGLRVRVGLAR